MNTYKPYQIFLALICLILILAPNSGIVQAKLLQKPGTDFTAIDAYVQEQMENLGIPGLALGIVHEGQVVHLQGYGVADSTGRAVTPQTPFYIASVTKSFTALAVMQLAEAGKIDLDVPVQTYLPWFTLADKEASAKITIRHLLNHTTGISNEDGEPDWFSQRKLEETVRDLDDLRLTQPVGTTFQYANLNYSIAGLVVEAVSGQSYADYVTQHIFKPLDMRHSYVSHAPALADGLAQGHRYIFGHAFVDEKPFPPVNLPGGGLIVSVEDMTHYVLAQLNDGRYLDAQVLSSQGITELHTPAVATTKADVYYAMGWGVGVMDGTPIISHDGALFNYRSQVYLFSEEGLGVILLANAHGFDRMMQIPDIANGVVNLLNGKPVAPVSLEFGVRFYHWTILLMPLLLAIGIGFSWRYRRNKGIRQIILVTSLYGGIALVWLFGVPLLDAPFSLATRFYRPEFAYCWITSVAIGIGWSVFYTAVNLRKRFMK